MKRLLATLVLASGCGAANLPTWQARQHRSCQMSSGSVGTDRQRALLAALIALEERGYTILNMEWPLSIEAHYFSSHNPKIFQTRWIVRVLPDASLEISTPRSWEKTHAKTSAWYANLTRTVQRYQCREPQWLRWQAENRGLLPVGVGVTGVDPAGSPAASPVPNPITSKGPR